MTAVGTPLRKKLMAAAPASLDERNTAGGRPAKARPYMAAAGRCASEWRRLSETRAGPTLCDMVATRPSPAPTPDPFAALETDPADFAAARP